MRTFFEDFVAFFVAFFVFFVAFLVVFFAGFFVAFFVAFFAAFFADFLGALAFAAESSFALRGAFEGAFCSAFVGASCSGTRRGSRLHQRPRRQHLVALEEAEEVGSLLALEGVEAAESPLRAEPPAQTPQATELLQVVEEGRPKACLGLDQEPQLRPPELPGEVVVRPSLEVLPPTRPAEEALLLPAPERLVEGAAPLEAVVELPSGEVPVVELPSG